MNNIDCTSNGFEHSYGLWSINDVGACRTCIKCGFNRVLPISDEIEEQIQKQREALVLLDKLDSIAETDGNIIGYLCAYLQRYVNFLDNDGKKKLASLMKKISLSSFVGIEDANCLSDLFNAIQMNDENFDEKLNTFFDYSLENLVVGFDYGIPQGMVK